MTAGAPAVALVAAGVLSAALTRVWIAAANRLGLVDPPNPLVPQHRLPTVNMGGLAVAAAALASSAAVALVSGTRDADDVPNRLWLLSAGGLAFVCLGAVDDLLRLSARAKFAAQIGLSLGLAAWGLHYPFTGSAVADVALSTLFLVTVTNAVNLTDVCDGLVAGLAVIAFGASALTVAAPSATLVLASAAAAGASAGFLLYNAPPARVFLGDAGSHWVGWTLGAILLLAPSDGAALRHAGVAALVAGVFLLELVLLVASRLRRGVPVWQGSSDHFALRLQAAGLSRAHTIVAAWTAALAFAVAAHALRHADAGGVTSLLLPAAALVAPAFLVARRFPAAHGPAAGRSAEPPRALWIHQNFVSARQTGNSRPIHIVAALIEAGWAVDIVTTQRGYLEDDGSAGDERCTVDRDGRLTIHRLRTRGGPRARALSWVSFGAAALVHASRFRRVDVVYASTPPLPQILVSMAVAVLRRAPMVLEVRDLWPLFLERLGVVRSPAVVALLRWIEAASYRAARGVVAVSPAFVPYLTRMGVRRETCVVAPTGGSDRDDASPDPRSPSRELKVVYAGSFNEAYDIGRLLRAAEAAGEAAAPIRWIFAGDGRSREAIVRASARIPGVVYAGALPKDDLASLLEDCDLGLVSLVDDPVLHMVVPGKLFDYWGAGLPVLCIAGGVPAAIVRAAGGGEVLTRPDAAQVAAAVAAFARLDPATRRAVGLRGRTWMHRHMPASRSARLVAREVARVRAEAGGRSQFAHVAGALALAVVDVLGRRARQAAADGHDLPAGEGLLLNGLAPPDDVTAIPPAPLSIPRLLSARPAGRDAGTALAWRSAIPSDVERPST